MPRRGFPPNPMPENYVRVSFFLCMLFFFGLFCSYIICSSHDALQLDQITDELYDKFCKEVLEEVEQECSPHERKLLDNMSSSGDFGVCL